jgi:phenylpropionate dioxygenase-like ring-hydroxylating dioxygenase large terminal subunit
MARWNDEPPVELSGDVIDSHQLPAHLFTDPDVFEVEQSEIFRSTWQYVAHESELSETGEYVTRDVGGRELFVVRDSDGELRAFYNVCAHRGCKLLDGDGSARHLRCPYHNWTFDLDGTLRSTPEAFTHAERNPDASDEDVQPWDAEENSLASIPLETMGPFVFVNLDSDPRPFSAFLDGLPDQVVEEAETHWSTLTHVERRERVIDANWKVFGSNYLECDHCHGIHPEYVQDVDITNAEFYGEGRCLVEKLPIADGEGRDRFFYVWPNFTLNRYREPGNTGITYHIKPLDHERTLLRADFFFEDEDLTDREREVVDISVQLQDEDAEICERQQEGLENGVLTQGQLGPNEAAVHHFHRLVEDALTDTRALQYE